MPTRVIQTGSFSAVSDDGRRFTVNVFTSVHEGHTTEGPYSTEGTKRLRTSGGLDVNRIGKGEYEIVDPDGNVRLVTTDPSAP